MSDLIPAQAAAVGDTSPRILCRAAAGSGKTRVLVQRVVRLLADHHPSEILCVTFTRAAAAEMRGRLLEAVPNSKKRAVRALTITTFHSWAARILREFHDLAGLAPNFSIRDEQDREDVILFVGRELNLKWKSAKRLWQEEVVRERYRSLMRGANALDFDMLEHELTQLLKGNSTAREQLQRRYAHVLVDEFQDTSEGQQALLDLLAPRNCFPVGDHAQSIYAFRGAHVEGFTALAASPAWTVREIATNFRSVSQIVDLATAIGRKMDVPGLEQIAGRGAGHDAVGEITGPDRDTLIAGIVDDIAGQAAAGVAWKDMAVLAPRWWSFKALGEALTLHGIPFRLAKRTSDLLDSATARWVVGCMRVAVNPHDHLSLYAALTAFTPRVSTGDWAGWRGTSLQNGRPILDVVADAGPGLAGVIRAARPIEHAGAMAIHLGPALSQELRALHLDSKHEELELVLRRVVDWTAESDDYSPLAFLDWYASRHLIGEDGEDVVVEEAPDAVTLSSVHGAKGLEWSRVWVLDCEAEGGAAWSKPEAKPETVQEDLRLLYVAVTRARDRLRLCWAGHRLRSPLLDGAL